LHLTHSGYMTDCQLSNIALLSLSYSRLLGAVLLIINIFFKIFFIHYCK
jgi:hypothetical protein